MNFILWTTRTWHVLSLQVLFLFIFIAGVEAQSALPDAIAPIWQQAAARPADFGLACMPLDRQGQTVLYNADAFPLASVSKLLIFIEYARRVDAGLIPLDEVVSVAALEAYNVPRTDRGAHDRFMAQYPAGTTTLPLWDVATEGMMQYSANTASDYVLHRLAPVDWTGLYALLGVYEASVPRSLSMIPLLMNSHQNGRAAAGSVEALSAEQGETLLDLYVHDRLWRDAEIVYRAEGGRGVWPAWDVQAAILQQHTSTGSVNDFRNILYAIYGRVSPLSENVRYMVRTAMRWRSSDFINANYVEYGSKLGFYSGGVLTLVAYGQPIGGEPVIVVVFLRNLPREAYRDLLREDSIGDFAQWVMFNACGGLNPLIAALD